MAPVRRSRSLQRLLLLPATYLLAHGAAAKKVDRPPRVDKSMKKGWGGGSEDIPGHGLPMMQQGNRKEIEVLESMPSWEDFYRDYIRENKPVVLRGAVEEMPAYEKWTDEYIKKHWGNKVIGVELNKTETRGAESVEMTVREFIDEMYSETRAGQLYAIFDFDKDAKAKSDVRLPSAIWCKEIWPQSVTLWMSSGGTSSVLHSDDAENVLMMLDGRKEAMLVHPDEAQNLYAGIAEARGSSPVHQEWVDMRAFPRFSNVTWLHGELNKGDILYIPHSYWHQVNSFGRNLGLNVWWQHESDWQWWNPTNPKEWDITRFGSRNFPTFKSLKEKAAPSLPCTPLPSDQDLSSVKIVSDDEYKVYTKKKKKQRAKAKAKEKEKAKRAKAENEL